jgi:hypothetical protein
MQQTLVPSHLIISYRVNKYPQQQFHTKNPRMHTFVTITTVLTLCYSDILQPSKGYSQGAQQLHFNSKVNKMSYQM